MSDANSPQNSAWVEPQPKPHRRGPALILALLAVLILGGWATQAWANSQYDEAAKAFSDWRYDVVTAQTQLAHDLGQYEALSQNASRMLEADAGLLTPASVHDALAEKIEGSASLVVRHRSLTTAHVQAAASKPALFWDLLSEAEKLKEQSKRFEHAVSEADRAISEVTASEGETRTLISDQFFAETIAAVNKFEGKHLSALNSTIIDLRVARDTAVDAFFEAYSNVSVDAYIALNEQAAAVKNSHAKILSEKAGPLLERRLKVEAWARKIAGGVLIDFKWRRLVNGFGQNGSAGGTASWNSAHGGYSTITLSNSVAELWPNSRMQALVAHEVGHAISAKCYEMFDWENRDANEQWATAWAISHGHTANGNGVSLYGYPRESLIKKAATCR